MGSGLQRKCRAGAVALRCAAEGHLFTIALTVVLAAAPVKGPKVAALDWTTTNVERTLAAFYGDVLARALRAHGVFVVTAQEVATLLSQEKQRQILNCSAESDSSCLTEVSSALGCDATLVVSLARLDNSLTANFKVLSGKDGHPLVEATAEAISEKDFKDRVERAAEVLADGLQPKTPANLRRLAWVPGIGGGVLVVLGAGGLLVAGQQSDALSAQLRAEKAVTQTSRDLAATGKLSQNVGWASLGLGSAALATAALLYAVGGDSPVQAAAVVTPAGAVLTVTGLFP